MSSPKFKKGDIVIRNGNKPTASFESIRYYKRIQITKVEKLSMVYYYGVDKPNQFNDDILFPQSSFDEMYDLDTLYGRRMKIEKICTKLER